ncbi:MULTISPECIES: DUF6455 family protein [unclassified Mesorhizobium]|uniref:DUF6455 family protein n=1 Tax=unclassified Mesorhizobium TaxID=325217 RepID=UPI000FCAFBA6|nr:MULTISPECIES: DUF6455 family protein [unclassified Mesorhizobium]RUZ72519.1 hypothetical protein EN947_27300 [Mesorhizobium sp. M7A.F.Ca.US.003.02.2.1]MBZ9717883.1 DUF6455 family protein [Mesorhizobium sp. AD1-1]RUY96556.1 hypothetical protein EN974_19270 [Mesorhizobium sp. M7A.F.Ca.CA.001.12.2.1]RUZ29426.1 hypothetical protein EN949_03905 [Mesorhizobium sp. M7A.F.Ca.US.007.01.2.1]RUZ34988.1 hypothetical protein EN948_35090 [Mesorhizobium sp. M7A.F.Ca.US.003.02.1.1]
MSLLDYLISVDARTALMGRMMRTVGVDKHLKVVADHAAVTNRAVNRCRACGHQDECMTWLDEHQQAENPPGYCRNSDLIARLQHVAGQR